MTGFALGVALLLALGGWMLRPAWRDTPAAAGPDRPAPLDLLAERLAALDRALAAGRLDPARHRAARAELERRVLDEALELPAPDDGTDAGARRTRWSVALGVPLAAFALYAAIGDRAGLAAGPTVARASAVESGSAGPDVRPEEVDAFLAQLAAHLETPSADPAVDVQGWTMLARAYAGLQRFAEADRALVRALRLAPDDANLLADRADVLAMRLGQRMAGEPERLAEEALRRDPGNAKALALAGTAAYERRDLDTARRRWQAARAAAPAGSEFATGLDRSLAEIGAAGGSMGPSGAEESTAANGADPGTGTNPGTVGASGATTTASTTATSAATESTPSTSAFVGPTKAGPDPGSRPGTSAAAVVRGRVTLAPALAGRAAPDDTVFVVVRAAEGPRMPLAVVRRRVADLPFDFALDDALAMQPALKLSAFDRVVVSARISRSGGAAPQPGDLKGESGPVSNRASGLALSIDAVQP